MLLPDPRSAARSPSCSGRRGRCGGRGERDAPLRRAPRAAYYFAGDPEQRGHGFGRSLMQTVASMLAAAGGPKINVMKRGDTSPRWSSVRM